MAMNNQSESKINELEEKLLQRQKLLEITNRIHSAQNLRQIIVDLRDSILLLFNTYYLTIYALDRVKNEIYSFFMAPSDQLSEIRVPVNNNSIAGYVANTGKIVNISDAYDDRELKAIDPNLGFDRSWDKKSGLRTREILCVPITHSNKLMGVIQILNKKVGTGRFSEEEVRFAQDIAEVLGIAFFNQERLAKRRKTRFGYLIARGLITESDLDLAWDEVRATKKTIENVLMEKYGVTEGGHWKIL